MFDTGAALIVFVIIGIIAFPIILISLKKSNKRKKLLRDFDSLAGKAKLTISARELWKSKYVIGIDNVSKKLLYIHKEKEKNEEVLIDLSEVSKCRTESFNKTSGNRSGSENNSDRIELVFSLRNPDIKGKVLEFYDSKEFMPTAEDFAFAEKWHKLISQAI